MSGVFSGFETQEIDLSNARIHLRVGGAGAPLLLLHGFPETHVMWHGIAEQLAERYRVIVPDLRGYGDSVAHDGDFTFRAMAQDQVAVMRALGHERFHVVSHDRGARTAHRMVLDYPETVQSVALMDILPTLDVWRTMDDWLAKRYYHWTFLAQPSGMPQALIKSDPVLYLHSALVGLSGSLEMFHPAALAAYEVAARKSSVVDAWCGDYAAGASEDLDHDRADEGRQFEMPCLVLWGTKGVIDHHVDPLECWQTWFPNAVGKGVEAGHFLIEEQPEEVLAAVLGHLEGA
ncbi:alpha/beta hydrolase [Shimia sp. R9_3]|uniref:alpha/beta fold hydrolase n=1 Tax=Shimia sp. R9_3 TaxID=2821113 RepID=UPI0032AF351F